MHVDGAADIDAKGAALVSSKKQLSDRYKPRLRAGAVADQSFGCARAYAHLAELCATALQRSQHTLS